MFDGDIEFYSSAADRANGRFCPDAGPVDPIETLPQQWLTQLCSTIPGIQAAVLVFEQNATVRRWSWGPVAEGDTTLEASLQNAAKSHQVVIERAASGNAEIAVPVTILSAPPAQASRHGAVALRVNATDKQQLHSVAELVSRNLGWLDLLLRAAEPGRAPTADVSELEGLLKCLQAGRDASTNGLALATELSSHFGCSAVAIGHINSATGKPARARDAQVIALSGLADFDPRRKRVQALAEVMAAHAGHNHRGELQRWLFDPSADEHEPTVDSALTRLADNMVCLSISVPVHAGVSMGLVCEWRVDQRPDEAMLERLENHAMHLLPVIATQLDAQPGWWGRAANRARAVCEGLFGRGRLHFKLLAAGTVVTILALCAAQIEFRISAPLTLEGATQRALTTPFDSFVSASHVVPGMHVKKGMTLVELDATGLELERDKWRAEHAKLEHEYDRALAELDHAEARILRAQINQSNAELQLVERKLARTELIAPFDGIVIKGDLSRSVGAPSARGDVLLELAPLDGYRVVLSVDERDIHAVRPGQRGALTLAALPHERWPFQIKTVASAAPDDDGVHRFRVEADLDNPSQQLRPGMRGIGKISVGEASPAYIASRRFLGWLQLHLWSRLP